MIRRPVTTARDIKGEADISTSENSVNRHCCLILHAHLPFVRHPEHRRFLEEDWLFETITESYVPLLMMLERLEEE